MPAPRPEIPTSDRRRAARDTVAAGVTTAASGYCGISAVDGTCWPTGCW
jgi:hypothetical protein